ncbi:MAG: glycosyltransferase [Bacteroidales bacterium]|nr:glycosyltransferase [Bacteroidales bacterium]
MTTNERPLFSVITVTYNAAHLLEKTMRSVLEQGFRDFEYILIDGASKDDTLRIIERQAAQHPDVAVKWVSEPDKGLYDAMNKGLKMAGGRFVWFMNAGDKVFDLNTFGLLAKAYEAQPDAEVLYGQSLIIDEEDRPLGERHKIAPKVLTKRSLLNGLVVCHQSILVSRDIAPLYDTQYRISADYDWTCKVLARSRRNVYVDGYISRFMTSGLSNTHRKKSWMERYRIMRLHFGLWATLWAHVKIVARYPFSKKKD